jgi:hypothetical protein
MPRRRPYIRTLQVTFKFTFDIGAVAPLCKAISKMVANLTKLAKFSVKLVKSCLSCWLLNIVQRLAVIWTRCQGLVTIGVAVLVAHYLAAQLNGQLQLSLPPETLQVFVEMLAVYLLKKQ